MKDKDIYIYIFFFFFIVQTAVYCRLFRRGSLSYLMEILEMEARNREFESDGTKLLEAKLIWKKFFRA